MQHTPRPKVIAAVLLLTAFAHAAPPAPTEPSAPSAPAEPGPPADLEPLPPPPEPSSPGPISDIPLYPEEAEGESSIWLDLGGFAQWFTQRAPLAANTPVAIGLGFGHRVGPARLAWRAHLFYGLPGGDPLAFLYLDLLSVEYVFSEGSVRPWARGAVGVGLDLADSGKQIDGVSTSGDPSLGDDGYFNEENGASGGFGLTAGAGLDLYFTAAWFVRAEALVRAYGGAGRSGLMGAGHLGVGWSY